MPQRLTPTLLSWASILEDSTREQAERTAAMPFVFPHVALMPDAHLGRGATVGSVIPTLRAVMPAAVGVDIGCGMLAVRLDLHRSELAGRDLGRLREGIERRVPLSAGGYNSAVHDRGTQARLDDLEARAATAGFDPGTYAGTWRMQLGSLGSGNHFIEVSVDESDGVWLFLHSGSRGVGNKIATHHTKVAQRLAERWWIALPDRDLAYLVEDTEEFWAYVRELRWAQHFALLNREEMMNRVLEAVAEHLAAAPRELERIACHHNYTAQERHYGKSVWVSRKGAIDASEGTPGLVPGSMGAASYVVRGKGDPVALRSAPHGAGRQHSRASARRTFTREDLDARMAGIEWGRSSAFLDEHPDAYKPVEQVMADAAGLVDVEHVLRQVVNVKGA